MTLLPSNERERKRVLTWTLGVPLSVAAILAGCNLGQRAPAPPNTAPALGAERGFFLNQDGDNASLAYGRANSDDVQLMLQCARGSRQVQILDVAHEPHPKGPAVLTLISGAVASDLKAQVGPDDTGQSVASAHSSTALPAFIGFRKSGAISVKLGKRVFAMTTTPGERISVERFFEACERK